MMELLRIDLEVDGVDVGDDDNDNDDSNDDHEGNCGGYQAQSD